MKLIGIDGRTSILRWPIGSPYRLRLRITDPSGAALPLVGRDLAMTVYRGSLVLSSVAGFIASDGVGDYAEFAFGGTVFAGIDAPSQAAWELVEVFADGKTPLLAGTVAIAAAATAAAGDGAYLTDGQFDAATWTPALDSLIVVLSGPTGPPGKDGTQPPAATLVTDDAVPKGMPLVISKATGRFRKADAAFYPLSLVVGLAQATTASGFVVDALGAGIMSLTDWTAVTGSAQLLPGQIYFLAVGGGLTTIRPTTPGQTVVTVGQAVSQTDLGLRRTLPTLL